MNVSIQEDLYSGMNELKNCMKDVISNREYVNPPGRVFDTEEKIKAEWDRVHDNSFAYRNDGFPETYEEFRTELITINKEKEELL